MEQERSAEEARQQALEELMKAGDEDMNLQFKETALGYGGEEFKKTMVEARQRVDQLKELCFGLGLTQEDINSYRDKWESQKPKQFSEKK